LLPHNTTRLQADGQNEAWRLLQKKPNFIREPGRVCLPGGERQMMMESCFPNS
jgi:hypothetical protein